MKNSITIFRYIILSQKFDKGSSIDRGSKWPEEFLKVLNGEKTFLRTYVASKL